MKSLSKWFFIRLVLFIILLVIFQYYCVIGLAKWSTTTIALFLGIGLLAIWEAISKNK